MNVNRGNQANIRRKKKEIELISMRGRIIKQILPAVTCAKLWVDETRIDKNLKSYVG